jgi:hypothetical protein
MRRETPQHPAAALPSPTDSSYWSNLHETAIYCLDHRRRGIRGVGVASVSRESADEWRFRRFHSGPFTPNGPITTNPNTWDKWLVWERFQSVDEGILIDPVLGPIPFPPGWGGDNFAQHHQDLNPATGVW